MGNESSDFYFLKKFAFGTWLRHPQQSSQTLSRSMETIESQQRLKCSLADIKSSLIRPVENHLLGEPLDPQLVAALPAQPSLGKLKTAAPVACSYMFAH